VIHQHRLHQKENLEIDRKGVLLTVGSETIHLPLRQTELRSANVEGRKKKIFPLTVISFPAVLVGTRLEIVIKYPKLRALLLP
jgi:hypothetical protein